MLFRRGQRQLEDVACWYPVIDEAQRAPALVSFLKTRIDQDRHEGNAAPPGC